MDAFIWYYLIGCPWGTASHRLSEDNLLRAGTREFTD
jgi:hypothetical protein